MGQKRREQKVEFTVAGAEQASAEPVIIPPARPVISFQAWWLQAQQAKQLKFELREALKKHFEARGFMTSGEFDKGLADFGL
jgi:hypothetical protein